MIQRHYRSTFQRYFWALLFLLVYFVLVYLFSDPTTGSEDYNDLLQFLVAAIVFAGLGFWLGPRLTHMVVALTPRGQREKSEKARQTRHHRS
jgi:Kef-type K+ transport system membrane component KefB